MASSSALCLTLLLAPTHAMRPSSSARGALLRSLSRRTPAVVAAFRDFDEFKSATTAYLATLNETALNEPEFPSPLSYKELQRNGRVDLVEGCMKFGGYVKVSEQLGGVSFSIAQILHGTRSEKRINSIVLATVGSMHQGAVPLSVLHVDVCPMLE